MNVSEKTKTLYPPEIAAGPVIPSPAVKSRRDHFDITHIQAGLKGHSIRAGMITLVSQGILFFLNVIQIVVLSRLLSPADFGLFAMVTVLTGLASTFKDGGLSMATIQRPEITHAQISSLFWINVLIGFGLAGIVAGLAPMLAWLYQEPRLIELTFAIAFTFVLSGTTIQHQALIRRKMQFGTLAAIQIASLTLGVVAAIVAAQFGAGYWALAAIPIVQAIVEAVMTWICSGWIPGLYQRGTGIRSMLTFGGNQSLASAINFIGISFDKVLIGAQLGPATLGLYERAYRLVTLPLTQINAPIMTVAIPALSRIADQHERYRTAFLDTIQKTMLIVGPATIFAIFCSEWIVLLAFGPGWTETAKFFSILSVSALLLPLRNAAAWLFISQNRTAEHLHFHAFDVCTGVALAAIGIQWGVTGICWSIPIRYCVTVPIEYCIIGRSGPVNATSVRNAMTIPALTTTASLLGLIALSHTTHEQTSPLCNILLAAITSAVAPLIALSTFHSGRMIITHTVQDIIQAITNKNI